MTESQNFTPPVKKLQAFRIFFDIFASFFIFESNLFKNHSNLKGYFFRIQMGFHLNQTKKTQISISFVFGFESKTKSYRLLPQVNNYWKKKFALIKVVVGNFLFSIRKRKQMIFNFVFFSFDLNEILFEFERNDLLNSNDF